MERIRKHVVHSMVVAILVLVPLAGFGHGEDKPGPHGGVIRMPGALHTELKQLGKSAVALYLLDIEFKNPITRDSKVEVTLKRGSAESELACKALKKNFRCALPKGSRFAKGDEVIVKAKRLDAQGIPISYTYPFTPTGRASADEHSGHHH